MRFSKMWLVGLFALVASNTQAAQQNFSVPYRLALMQDGMLMHENLHQSYGFGLIF
jgi:hypothetical protein